MPGASFEHFKILWDKVNARYSTNSSKEISFEELADIELNDDEILSTTDLLKIKKKFIDKIEDNPATVNLPQSIYYKLFAYIGINGFGDLIDVNVDEIVATVEKGVFAKTYDFEEVGFLGRESELAQLATFITDSNKTIFALYGIPMIGKTWLIEQFVKTQEKALLKAYQVEIIKLNPVPKDLQKAKEDLAYKNNVLNKFIDNSQPTLLVIQNFEELLEWKGDNNKYHLIKDKYADIQHSIGALYDKPSFKLIIESRFHVKFNSILSNTKGVQYLANFNLKGINTELFWQSYQKREVSRFDFDRLCENFNNHTALLALAINDRELYEDNLSEAAYSPTYASRDLWEKVESIINKLDDTEVWILSCLTFLQKPINEEELIRELSQIPELKEVHDLRNYLFSLKKKLLTKSLKGQYDLNPYVREVCFTFLNDHERSRIRVIAALPFFKEYGSVPKYDIIKQAVERSDHMYLFNLGKKLRRERNYKTALSVFESGLLIDPKKDNVFNEIAIIHKKQGNIDLAIHSLEKAIEFNKNNVHSQNELAICYKEVGKTKEAIDIWEKMIAELDNDSARNELAKYYRGKKEYLKAVELLKVAVSKGNIHSYTELVICYHELGRIEEAINLARQGIQKDIYPCYTELAKIYENQGKLKEAYLLAKQGMEKPKWDSSRLEKRFIRLKKKIGNMKKVFLSYSHKDEDIKNRLDVFLSTLKRSNKIATWNDRKIMGGQNWDNAIKKELDEADVILLLISADFINSNYIWDVELTKAIDKHKKGEAIVIPIFSKPCDFKDTPFQSIQGLPKDAKFITTYPNQDSAYTEVVQGIRRAIDN